MKKATFEGWDIDEVKREFKLKFERHLPSFTEWLASDFPTSEYERQCIALLQDDLFLTIDSWNEDELKFKFIAPFVNLVRFETAHTSVFTQRTLSATVNDIELSGRVDFIVATGKSKPISPFFFLHEYKRTFAPDSDPLAQLLVEMVAAQELNAQSSQAAEPLYGCYVIGRFWYFVLLHGNRYTTSLAYDATQEQDIYGILSILKGIKAIIAKRVEEKV
jgi:hypothetical protein